MIDKEKLYTAIVHAINTHKGFDTDPYQYEKAIEVLTGIKDKNDLNEVTRIAVDDVINELKVLIEKRNQWTKSQNITS